MKSNELMIGDWVKVIHLNKIGRVYRVDAANGHGNEYAALLDGDFDCKDLEPIPLTPEILEKNGMNPFDIDKLTEKATAKWWHKGGDFFIKQYHFKHNGFNPSYSFGCHNHTLIEGIEYVHELQHALKLCKIEKEIVV